MRNYYFSEMKHQCTCSMLKCNIHYMLFLDHRVMGRTSFITAWKRHIPFILTTKPRTDLCWTCQRYSQKIYHSANTSVETKRELLDKHLEHLRVVDLERQVYRNNVVAAKEVIKHNPAQLGQHPPNSTEGAMHYSFDFAQQVRSLFVCLFIRSFICLYLIQLKISLF